MDEVLRGLGDPDFGFELGRLLRLTFPQKIAAAALARNFGLWTTVLSAPLPAALAWASAGAGGNSEEAQRSLLGLSFTEAGAKWLALDGAEPLYVDIAAGRSSLGRRAPTFAPCSRPRIAIF